MFFNPLLAARIDFREWETFFFGTARRIEGKSSRRESRTAVHREGRSRGGAATGKVHVMADEEGWDERDQDGRR